MLSLVWPSCVSLADKQFQGSVEKSNYEPRGSFSTMLLDVDRDEAILEYLMYPLTEDNFNHYARSIDSANTKLEELIKAMLDGLRNPQLEWTQEEKNFVTNSFPIILTLNSPNQFLKKVGYEWRSKKPLKLGTDISHVYTDSQHIKVLQDFFDENKIKVTVSDCQLLKSPNCLVSDKSLTEKKTAGQVKFFSSPIAQSANNPEKKEAMLNNKLK